MQRFSNILSRQAVYQYSCVSRQSLNKLELINCKTLRFASQDNTEKSVPNQENKSQIPTGNGSSKFKAILGLLGLGGLGFVLYSQNQKKILTDEKKITEIKPEPECEPIDKKETSSKMTVNQPIEKEAVELPAISPCSTEPDNCPELPDFVPYLIIGAGTAAFSAFRAIRSKDPKAKILVIGEECNLPYMRPPLSKELWFNDSHALTEKLKFKQWNGRERSIFYEKDCYYIVPKDLANSECGGVSVALGRKVEKIDIEKNKVVLDNNSEIKFSKCLIATGGKPRQHPVISQASDDVKSRTILFRKIVDFEKLDCISLRNKDVAIIGGGFLGSELAVALGNRKKKTKGQNKIYQIFSEKGNMGKILPEYLSKWTMDKIKKDNVDIMPETKLKCARMCGDKIELVLNDDKTLKVDHIVVAIGLEPEISIAQCSGLELDDAQGGFLVNAEMKAREDVYVAGDAASFYDIQLGRRRVEHHDHAVVSGRLAGENMTGAGKPYWHQSMFWSDLGPKIGFEAIGLVDNNLPTVAVFAKADDVDNSAAIIEANNQSETEEVDCAKKRLAASKIATKPAPAKGDEDFGKGVVFYMKDKVIVGMLMWNVFDKMPIARKILREQKKYDDLTPVAKLFNLHAKPAAK